MANFATSGLRNVDRLVAFALPVLLVCVGLLLWPATHGPFLFDDYANLRNLASLGAHPDAASIGRYLHDFVGDPGRPLGALSFLIDDQAWPALPEPFKRTNLLFHLLTGTFVFMLARASVRLDASLERRAALIALVATAAWLLSPMQLAATMLVVQRMNILSALFTVAGLVAYIALLQKSRPRAALALLWSMAGVAFLCKENGVLAFAYAAVLNHTLLRPTLAGYPPRARVTAYAGTWLPLLALAVGMWLHSGQLLASYQLRDFSMAERLMTEPRVLVDYLARIFVPRLGGQGIFHDQFAVSTGLLRPATTLPALLFCVGAIAAGILLRVRRPWLSFAILWFFAGHLLESTFLPLELYFEHRNYLPIFGPALGAVVLVARSSGPGFRTGVGAIGIWLALACLSTGLNAKAWGDELRLARIWHAENPLSIRSTQLLARTLANRGRQDLAREVLVSAYRAQPDKVELAFQLALLDCASGRFEIGRVHELQRLARSARPSQSIDAAVRRLRVMAGGGKCALDGDDWNRLADNLLANRAYGRVGALAGSLHYEKGMQAESDRDLNAAMSEYDQAYRYMGDARIPQHQAALLVSAGLPEDALRYLAISDHARSSPVKRFLFDIRDENAKMRRLVKMSMEREKAGRP